MADSEALLRDVRAQSVDEDAELQDHEIAWRDKQPFLASRGYSLRPRFHQGWVPSWELQPGAEPEDFEDFWPLPYWEAIIDATRDSDGRLVCIKRVLTSGSELQIARYFSTPPLSDDPQNHCIPILDYFEDDVNPNISYIVMPHMRRLSNPPFEIVNEVLDFVEQLLEGMAFMHGQGVAHRDAAATNILMDAQSMYPMGYHPVQQDRLPIPNWSKDAPRYTRTSAPRPVRYYFADFGMSTHFPPGVPRLVTSAYGANRDAPELSDVVPYDPFKLDIFVLGNVFKTEVHDKYFRTEFLGPLIAAMMQRDPAARPTAQEALQRWRHIKTRVSLIQRAARLRGRDEGLVYAVLFDVLSFIKVVYILSKKLARWSLGWLAMLFV